MPRPKQEKHSQKLGIQSFVAKKPKDHRMKREKNTFTFEGFYQRLKSLDMKQSHTMQMSHTFDTLLSGQTISISKENQSELTNALTSDGLLSDQQMQSNFIALLRYEKMSNRTLDFKKIFSEVEPLAFSQALVLLNKNKIIERLTNYLQSSDQNEDAENQAASIEISTTNAKCLVLDLLIALIKDLREEIYQDFVSIILPAALQSIDSQNVRLLDKIFTMISFALKYLVKSILGDLQTFWRVYSELVNHKNRHLRIFAAQGFSYVLRKVLAQDLGTEKICSLILEDCLGEQTQTDIVKAQGISEVFFQVMYGTNEDLYSTSTLIIKHLLKQYSEWKRQGANSLAQIEIMIRFLFIKLFNNIDSSKQLPIFECIYEAIEEETSKSIIEIDLFLLIIDDAVRLKYGRRVSHLTTIQIFEILNMLCSENTKKQKSYTKFEGRTKMILAQCVSSLFYFKHQSLQQIFFNSKIDITHSRHLFNYKIFQIILCGQENSETNQIIECFAAYFQIFLQKAESIQVGPSGDLPLDYNAILGLKNRGDMSIEFTFESHSNKINQILNRFVEQTIFLFLQSSEIKTKQNLLNELIAIYNRLKIASHNHETELDNYNLSDNVKTKLLNILQESIQQNDSLSIYNQLKFLQFLNTKDQQFLNKVNGLLSSETLQKQIKNAQWEMNPQFDKIKAAIEQNIVLKNYPQLESNPLALITPIQQIFDLRNSDIFSQNDIIVQIKVTQSLLLPIQQQLDQAVEMVVKLGHNITALRNLKTLVKDNILKKNKQEELFQVLSQNLSKNSREIRLVSLQILQGFESLTFEQKEDQAEEYKKECKIVDLMYHFEKDEISFTSERTKLVQLENLEVMLRHGVIPQQYYHLIYNFLVGCFWIKFTPLFQNVALCISSLINSVPDQFKAEILSAHMGIVQSLIWMTQLSPSQEKWTTLKPILFGMFDKKIIDTGIENNHQRMLAFKDEICLDEQSLEINDFAFQMCRSLQGCLHPTILNSKELKSFIFDVFFNFLDFEHNYIKRGIIANEMNSIDDQVQIQENELIDRMIRTNQLESKENKEHRKQSFSTLAAFLDLFKKADSLKQVPRIGTLQNVLETLLSSSDSKIQQTALDCLIKTGHKQGLLQKYRKLLEGFCDDEKFKDMIPIMIHGTKETEKEQSVYDQDTEDKTVQKAKRKETKSLIPHLEDQDRLQMLPIIIKLLQSKLIQKKGAINKKSLFVRRNLIFKFFASFNPLTEFHLIIDELLTSINLYNCDSQSQLFSKRLSTISFNQLLSFINSLDAMVRQMGRLLTNYIPTLANIILQGFVSNTKLFLSVNKSENDEIFQGSLKQARECLRKTLSLVNTIYRKFSTNMEFISDFSEKVYRYVVFDQLPVLSQKYLVDRSQILEIICLSWPSSSSASLVMLQKYPNILENVFEMLKHHAVSFEVVELQMSLLKRLICESVDVSDAKLSTLTGPDKDRVLTIRNYLQKFESTKLMKIDSDTDSEDFEDDEDLKEKNRQLDELVIEEIQDQKRKICLQILETQVEKIADSLLQLWQNKHTELKSALSQKGGGRGTGNNKMRGPITGDRSARMKYNQIKNEEQKKFQSAKDLLLVISELANYLEQNSPVCSQFLEMITQIIQIKNLHRLSQGSNHTQAGDDVLTFSTRSLAALIPKVQDLSWNVVDKIAQLFLHLVNARVRQLLALSLTKALESRNLLSKQSLDICVGLNKLKRGLADLELDTDSAIETMQNFKENLANFSPNDLCLLTYNILYLCSNSEYSVREYACAIFKQILEFVAKQNNNEDFQQLIFQIENQIVVIYLQKVRDEQILKSVLDCLRSLIIFQNQVVGIKSQNFLGNLSSVLKINNSDEEGDFFANIFSIRLKQRQKSLRKLATTLKGMDKIDCETLKAFEKVIIPLIDYIVLGGKDQFQNQRDSVSYDKEQKRELLECAMEIYELYSKLISWPSYFTFCKKYLYKLKRAETRITQVNTYGDPELEKEKIITKVICRILNGFSFNEVPDAIVELGSSQLEYEKRQGKRKPNFFELETLLQQQPEEPQVEENVEMISEDSWHEEMEVDTPDMSESQILSIQQKMKQQILPILFKHLTDNENKDKKDPKKDKNDSQTFRGFAVVCYAKTIRKLDTKSFQQHLHKLFNLICLHGLRSRELSYREKARKALVKLINEIGTRFLSELFDEMKTQLTRGFQEHVYLFTVHFLLQGLQKEGALDGKGTITTYMVEKNIAVLLSELFGELNEEKINDQGNERKLIKEAKTRKAIPIFEIFTQYIDFDSGFFSLISPIVRVLQQSPSTSKVQQCEELLSRISSALLKNSSVKGAQLLLCLYSLINKGVSLSVRIKINDEKQVRDYGAKPGQTQIRRRTTNEYKEANLKIDMYWNKGHETVDKKKTEEICGRVLATFGLQCLKKALRHKDIIKDGIDDKELLVSRLDPFVPLLLQAFKTYHNPIVVSTLHIIGDILTLDLPSFKEQLKKFLSRIFKLFETNNQGDPDFINSLFKCTSELIKTYAVYQDLSEHQLSTLLKIIRDYTDKANVQGNAFQCLRSIVYRKFQCSALYDIVEEVVQEQMVRSNVLLIRQICQTIFIQFLLDYPLENTRIQSHLSFVLKNLNYKSIDGRLSLLTTLLTLFQKLPEAVIDLYGELFFFTLLLRTVNEENKDVRAKASEVLQALVSSGKVGSPKIKQILNSVFKMGASDSEDLIKKHQLCLAKLFAFSTLAQQKLNAQKTDEFVKLKSSELQLMIDQIFDEVVRIEYISLEKKVKKTLAGRKRLHQDQAEVSDSEESNGEMARFLRSVQLIEKEEKQAEDEESDEQDDVSAKNTLVYNALLTIETLIQSQNKDKLIENLGKHKIGKTLVTFTQFHQSYWVRLVSQRILGHLFAYSQANSKNLVPALGFDIPEQINEFIFDLANSLVKILKTEEMREQIVKNLIFLLNFQLTNDTPGFKIEKLFEKISFIGRKSMLDIKTSHDKLVCILLFFKVSMDLFEALANEKGESMFAYKVSHEVIQLTYRLSTDEQYSATELKDQSLQIQEQLQKLLPNGIDVFVKQYNIVKNSILSKRADRKQKEKRLAVGSIEGQEILQKKRKAKYEKKKAIHKEKVFIKKFTQ